MRLGLSLPILPRETLPSFVSHVAQKNGSRHVQDFVEDMGLSWRRILQLDPETVLELADLTGVDADLLAAESFAPFGDGFFRFRGHDLPRSLLDRSALKFCPICIRADRDSHGRSWGRALWQIDALHICPDHGTKLGALEPPDYPRCPHDFAGRIADDRARIAAVTTVEAGHDAVRLARYLSDRLYGERHSESPSWLDDLPVDVAARLCENVGTLNSLGPDAHPKVLTLNERADAAAAGFRICAQGPDALREVYDIVRRSSQSTKGGFYADFSFYTRWLQRLTQPERHQSILGHFRDFVLENYPLAPGDEVLGRACHQRRWFTWADLGRKYGLTSGRIARFQRAVGTVGDDLRRVAAGAHDADLVALSTGLDRKAVAQRLMVHPSVVDTFLHAGLLGYGIVLPKLEKLFLPKDLDAFLLAVAAKADAVDEPPEGSFPLPVICNKAKVKSTELIPASLESSEMSAGCAARTGCRPCF